MTGFTRYLESLTDAAKAASAAELEHQKQAAARAAELRRERELAWRRLNLMRSVGAAVGQAEDEAAAAAAGRGAMLREVGWSGAAEAQGQVADRFAPVVRAVWTAARGEAADPTAALAEFEAWFAAERGVPFLGLMEREIVELPLVDI
jgi:hypothetical protein